MTENGLAKPSFPSKPTIDEFKAHWDFDEFFIIHNPTDALLATALTESSVSFLAELGVPIGAGYDFVFQEQDEFLQRLSSRENLSSAYDKYRVVGLAYEDDSPLCVDESRAGAVFAFPPKDLLSVRDEKLAECDLIPQFVNSSIEQLLYCCLGLGSLLQNTREQNGSEGMRRDRIPVEFIEWFAHWLVLVDPEAMSANSYWSALLQDLENRQPAFMVDSHGVHAADGPYVDNGAPTHAAREFALYLVGKLDEMREFASNRFLNTYNDTWRESFDSAIDETEFCSHLKHPSIMLGDLIGSATIIFEDSQMFAGHSIIVSVADRKIVDSSLFG